MAPRSRSRQSDHEGATSQLLPVEMRLPVITGQSCHRRYVSISRAGPMKHCSDQLMRQLTADAKQLIPHVQIAPVLLLLTQSGH